MEEEKNSRNTVFQMIQEGKISLEDGLEVLKYLEEQEQEKISEEPRTAASLADTINFLKEVISKCTFIPKTQIYEDEPLENIGIDSIMIKSLNKEFQIYFPNVSSTVLFECQNVKELAEYFIREHRAELSRILEGDKSPKEPQKTVEKKQKSEVSHKEQEKLSDIEQPEKISTIEQSEEQPQNEEFEPIAIIGMEGMFPKAKDLDEYWENLIAGRDCIETIPLERFEWRDIYSEKRGEKGKIYCNCGGFLKDIEQFDPLFFNISHKEAVVMDPHERLMLENSWHAIEDAGYTKESLKNHTVGVFSSAMYGHYEILGVEETNNGNPTVASSLFSNLPNRVSYTMNFHGPSVAVESACSSFLEALRLACQSIHNKDCDMAVVGGTNLTLHRSKYQLLCQMNFLASDGRCHTMGEGGDGYVPGEGSGVIVIKSLKEARKDRDHIYGIIDGIATNHGGKTNGFSVPSPLYQAELIEKVIRQSHVNPETINYVEAHGTGTSLGDPIEITGLTKAYRKFTDKKQYVELGSVKSNIGHCEAASGVAGVLKILLMLKNKKYVPSIHSDVLNNNIDFANSPFSVIHEYKDWPENVVESDGEKKVLPRRAAISAFGAGGTNVHAILEENTVEPESEVLSGKERIFVLSARSEEALKEYCKEVIEFLNDSKDVLSEERFFAEVVYGFQTGREPFEYRLAIPVSSNQDIIDKLSEFQKTGNSTDGIYYSYTKKMRTELEECQNSYQSEDSKGIEQELAGDIQKLAWYWSIGGLVHWEELYQEEKINRIPLPKYPYQMEFCYIKKTEKPTQVATVVEEAKPQITEETAEEQVTEQIEDIIAFLTEIFAEETDLAIERIDPDVEFERYGMDSNMVVNLTNKLEEKYGKVKKTLFYEFNTVRELAEYLQKNVAIKAPVTKTEQAASPIKKTEEVTSSIPTTETLPPKTNEIAIIGLQGRYPKADSLNELWENLLNQIDCVTEIPKDRWDYHIFDNYDVPVSKWGGFLNHVDQFDPLFFHISPLEAEVMDPQERLFLQVAWNTIEDAGYTTEELGKRKVGVYVGATYQQYQMIGVEETLKGNPMAMNSAFSAIANRVSYCLNLHGPSMAVDTMCSSSLTALHLACQSILNGESDMAIAGGVNINVHPNKYLLLGLNRFTSTDGRCRSFGKDGDGYGPSEGVGAVLLKPLEKAIEDGDCIYGVIKGSALNHRGKTSAYTVPSPVAEAEVIKESLKNAGVSADSISYVEAMGTGTSLGDPIEIDGLAKAFEGSTKGKQYCPIGCIKSNIGHSEPASGMAGLTKILLQMKHKKLVPSIHSDELNPNIDFEETPFYVQHELVDWNCPKVEIDDKMVDVPRRAILSAFGAGGSNANFIIEEYEAPEEIKKEQEERLFIFSAKGEKNLRQYIENFIPYIKSLKGQYKAASIDVREEFYQVLSEETAIVTSSLKENETFSECGIDEVSLEKLKMKLEEHFQISLENCDWNVNLKFESLYRKIVDSLETNQENQLEENSLLQRISYTLQTGREQFPVRVAVISDSFGSLETVLQAYLNKEELQGKLFVSEIKDIDPLRKRQTITVEGDKSLEQLASIWIQGEIVDFTNYYKGKEKIHKISMPGYAFSQDSYWVHTTEAKLLDSTGVSMEVEEKETVEVEADSSNTLEDQVRENVRMLVAETIKLKLELLDNNENFGNYGYNSNSMTVLSNKLAEQYRIDIDPVTIYSNSTVNQLTTYLLENGDINIEETHVTKKAVQVSEKTIQNDSSSTEEESTDIAIIGMSGMLPDANDLQEFWNNLVENKDCVSVVPEDHWDYREYYSKYDVEEGETNSKWGGFINGVYDFDASFFNISPFEAEQMDPQQRLIMESVWNTIEDAGYKASSLAGKDIGVFMTSHPSEYPDLLIKDASDLEAQTILGSVETMLANRVSYWFNFHGPSESMNTACSGTLTTLNRAIKALIEGECEMAVAGGASLSLTPESFVMRTKLGVLSPTGKCKTFDADADGFVKGEGIGTVLLKPLKKAEKDNDMIYAVIRGCVAKHGGKANSITSPNTEAQANVIAEAIEQSHVAPETISFIETHGTGTILGDPIEIDGLKKAFQKFPMQTQKPFCGLGSVKTNIGHLEPMAGLAGVFKVVLAMQHQLLPASIHFKKKNPYIHLEKSPFYLLTKNQPWEHLKDENNENIAYRAGVSSFGIGGSNIHVILEEYQNQKTVAKEAVEQTQLICISAKTETSLKKNVKKLLEFLKEDRLVDIEDLSYSLIACREVFPLRICFMENCIDSLIQDMELYLSNGAKTDAYMEGNTSQETDELSQERKGDDIIKNAAFDWVHGRKANFSKVYANWNTRNKIRLPHYQFDVKCYRKYPENEECHPMLSRNESRLDEAKYITTFTGRERYFHYNSKAERIFPTTAFTELAIAACANAIGNQDIEINHMICYQSFVYEKAKSHLVTKVRRVADNQYAFIICDGKTEDKIYARGDASVCNLSAPDWKSEKLELEADWTVEEKYLNSKFVTLQPELVYKVFDMLLKKTGYALFSKASEIGYYVDKVRVYEKPEKSGKVQVDAWKVVEKESYIEVSADLKLVSEANHLLTRIDGLIIRIPKEWISDQDANF